MFGLICKEWSTVCEGWAKTQILRGDGCFFGSGRLHIHRHWHWHKLNIGKHFGTNDKNSPDREETLHSQIAYQYLLPISLSPLSSAP
jgi:hypothetical protein